MLCLLMISLVQDALKGILIASDVSEILKVACYCIFFVYFYSCDSSVRLVSNNLYKLYLYVSLFIIIFNIFDVFSLFGFRDLSYILYKRETVGILSDKAVSPLFTTYNLASFLMLPIAIFLNSFYLSVGFIKKVKYFTLFFLLMLIVLLTQSRSSLICLILVILLVFIMNADIKKWLLFIIIVICSVATVLYNLEFISKILPYTFNGIQQMLEGKSNSANIRAEQIAFVFNGVESFSGQGVSKSLFMLESLYSLYPYRYGILFTMLFLFLCVYISYLFYKYSRSIDDFKIKSLYIGLAVWFFTYPVAAISSAHHDTTKYSFFFYGMVGFAFYLKNAKKDNAIY